MIHSAHCSSSAPWPTSPPTMAFSITTSEPDGTTTVADGAAEGLGTQVTRTFHPDIAGIQAVMATFVRHRIACRTAAKSPATPHGIGGNLRFHGQQFSRFAHQKGGLVPHFFNSELTITTLS
ncbi:MAG: hypothetical protein Q8P97_00970 [bacterium]|nr:hypothetical protein [bacterium]